LDYEKQETGTVDKLAGYLRISTRQVEKLEQQGVLVKVKRGKYPLAENIERYFADKYGDIVDKNTEAEIEKQKLRKITRENDLAESDLAPLNTQISVNIENGQRVIRELDALRGRIKNAMPEITARALERVQDTIDKTKNIIAQTPDRLRKELEGAGAGASDIQD